MRFLIVVGVRAIWHEHVFSPLCKDEVHGRFDALIDAHGILVLDVGAKRVAAYAGTPAEAVEITESASG